MPYTAPFVAILAISLVYYKKGDILRWMYRRNNAKEGGPVADRGDIYRMGDSRFGIEGHNVVILTEEDTSVNILLTPRPPPIVMASLHPGDVDVLPDIQKYNHSYHTRTNIKARDLIPWMTELQTLEILLRDGWLEEVSGDDCVPV